MKASRLVHRFVEFIPDELDELTLYVCLELATVVHKCCCGCGSEVVTPLSPTDWKMTFDGETISLHPSIGNWGFECRSHYWIQNSRVRVAEEWSPELVRANRESDHLVKEAYFGTQPSAAIIVADDSRAADSAEAPERKKPWWKRFWPW